MSKIICFRILVIGDSRVKYLSNQLNNTTLNLLFEVVCLPGAKIEDLVLKTRTLLSYEVKYDLIVFVGGINNITRLSYRPCRHASLRYNSIDKTIEGVMSRLYMGVDKIQDIVQVPLVVTTIPGIDLIKYSPQVWFKLLPLQPLVDSSMIEINRQIRGLNRQRGMSTLNLAYPVHRCAGHGGRYYAHYTLLRDGLHPSNLLISKWVDAIIDYCVKNIQGIQHVQRWIPDHW